MSAHVSVRVFVPDMPSPAPVASTQLAEEYAALATQAGLHKPSISLHKRKVWCFVVMVDVLIGAVVFAVVSG